jgi:hypothetical protein
MEKLSSPELIRLVRSVFPHLAGDRELGIMFDFPRESNRDNSHWKTRRKIGLKWFRTLRKNLEKLELNQVRLIAYPDVGSNNADLPEMAFEIRGRIPVNADGLAKRGIEIPFKKIFESCSLLIAPTEYSATAPLKNAAKTFGFRAATMPGFSPSMIPALRIDYGEVSRRVNVLKEKLDLSERADVIFTVDNAREYKMVFDLRFRKAHLSSGRFPEKSTAGNVPSGETYIVPYEGELREVSQTNGTLPVQIKDDVLLFNITKNRAVDVHGIDPIRDPGVPGQEQEHLKREPAYGNMAELGFGVLGDFGLSPIGETLLDEKLGFHVAFGRSDHFDGSVGPGDFTSPASVIHLDRVYISSIQPRISVKSVTLCGKNGKEEMIISQDKYLIF